MNRPAHLDEREMEESKTKYPPSIDMKPEPVEVAEGEPAKFMVKVSGYPRPRVTWWVNGTMIMTVSIDLLYSMSNTYSLAKKITLLVSSSQIYIF